MITRVPCATGSALDGTECTLNSVMYLASFISTWKFSGMHTQSGSPVNNGIFRCQAYVGYQTDLTSQKSVQYVGASHVKSVFHALYVFTMQRA